MNAIPYPGLRPFTTDESGVFFGRETHSDQLIEKLAHSRFVAVLGLSGCGKSSLVQAGMIAGLENGYFTKAGSDWQVLLMRPGSHPMRNLVNRMDRKRMIALAAILVLIGAGTGAAVYMIISNTIEYEVIVEGDAITLT